MAHAKQSRSVEPFRLPAVLINFQPTRGMSHVACNLDHASAGD